MPRLTQSPRQCRDGEMGLLLYHDVASETAACTRLLGKERCSPKLLGGSIYLSRGGSIYLSAIVSRSGVVENPLISAKTRCIFHYPVGGDATHEIAHVLGAELWDEKTPI